MHPRILDRESVMSRARVDPELLRQLEEAEKSARTDGRGPEVQAVFTLGGPDASVDVLSREETDRVVRALVERARAASGTAPSDMNVFPNLGAFVVVAPPEFVRAVADQEGVLTAAPNRRAGLGLVKPRRKRAVSAQPPATRRRPAR